MLVLITGYTLSRRENKEADQVLMPCQKRGSMKHLLMKRPIRGLQVALQYAELLLFPRWEHGQERLASNYHVRSHAAAPCHILKHIPSS
jgi:hypothetical protein